MSNSTPMIDHEPERPKYIERIGDQDFMLEEQQLHVFDEVSLWNSNPRLMNVPGAYGCQSEEEVEAGIQRTRGYESLAKSIRDLGQMEAIYA